MINISYTETLTLEGEENEEGKFIRPLGRVTDMVEEAEMVV
jgi:hypothetical protein